MMPLNDQIEQLYAGQERLNLDEIQRRAVIAELPPAMVATLDNLPEREYEYEELLASIDQIAPHAEFDGSGVPPEDLADDDLFREIGALHRTRLDTLRHGSSQALRMHTERTAELEDEYLRRRPEREVDPEREREGARGRAGQPAG